MRFHFSRTELLQPVALIALLVISLSVTWLLASRPWRIDAVIGGADSAIVGTGFFTKEQTPTGMPFRWTSNLAVINLPYIQSTYLISFRAYIPEQTVNPVIIKERALPIVTVPIQPGFRTYHILWGAPPTYRWFDLFAPRRFVLEAKTRFLSETDQRKLGIVLNRVIIQSGHMLEPPIAPLAITGLTLIAISGMLWPLQGKRLVWFAGIALFLPLGYDLLVWHPPTANDYTWLPMAWLPGMVAAITIGIAFARIAARSIGGAAAIVMIVALLAFAALVTLQWHWVVEGPDYGWHLNHGGSWERVFRAHPFYPFGLPLILWLGQLAGDQALLFGRLAGVVATLLTIGATVMLVWRVTGPSYAWLAGMTILASPIVIAYGVLVSTDAPMAGLAALALLALAWYKHPRIRQIVLAGICLGLAYLFRFQAIVLLVPLLLWLYWQPAPALPAQAGWLHRLGRFAGPLLLLISFLIASAPQWLLDIRDTGRPFATQQYVNIWLFAFERNDVVPGASTFEQLWFILNFDPYTLWRHWLDNLRQFGLVTIHQLLVWPIGLLAFLGMSLASYHRDRRYILLLAWIVVYTLVVTLTANKERFFLPVLPALVAFVAVLTAQITERVRQYGKQWALLPVLMGAVLCYWSMIHLAVAEAELAVYGFVRS